MGAILGKKKKEDATARDARNARDEKDARDARDEKDAWDARVARAMDARDAMNAKDVRDEIIRGNTMLLWWACRDGNLVVVEDILGNKDVDVNADYNWPVVGAIPLVSAVIGNKTDIVRRLLEHPGLQIGKKGVDGLTCLHWACVLNRVSIVKLICQDIRCTPSVVNRKCSYGVTALMMAVQRGNLDIVKELDKEGTDFRGKDSNGRTLIDRAKMMNNEEMLEYLLERKKKVDSLKVIAACKTAKYVKNKANVEDLKMEIPETLRHYLAGFVDN